MLSSQPAKQAWILHDEKDGSTNQCLALAEHMGWQYEQLSLKSSRCFGSKTVFEPPLPAAFPDYLIASGSRLVLPTLWLKRASQGRSRAIQILAPNKALRPLFDAIISPHHDQATGTNLIPISAALTRASQTRLSQEAAKIRQAYAIREDFPKAPYAFLALGGPTSILKMDQSFITHLLADLSAYLAANPRHSLLVCQSRRTPKPLIDALENAFANHPRLFLWHEAKGPNPYWGFLGLAEHLIVTCDSVSMLAECAASGKPTYAYGQGTLKASPKFTRFHEHMLDQNHMRWFCPLIEPYEHRKLADENKAATVLKQKGLT